MTRYRMLAIDLDDTLLNSRLQISPRTKEAIRRARDAGVHVTLATGRMYRSALPYARELELNLPLITYQGALIKEVATEEVLLHRPLPLELAREAVALASSQGHHVNVYLDDNLYVGKLTPEAEKYRKISGVPIYPVGDLVKLLDKRGVAPTKVLVVGEETAMDELGEQMLDRFGKTLHICKSKPHFLELSHPEATKGHALDTLARRWDLTRDQVIAVGDSYNDLEMIEYAGLGVVMGNACPDIKAKADYITQSNEQDGVAEVIAKFIFED
ncbi:Cof-type HAD-IIB family hydrolase [Desulforamulus ruminis]|uniref:Cof-like hydrolase n=1 Tax=Desulforamulus ruminis (strain ATCC 23193 / DSM 2154 / NCIMB 8452 / DL) TaxID=696281 RepID=F6DNB8_DESRL|nr:Cof-type HAD-IIB family hydrolase [Desulforamulus ruminis]AEG61809.1 Cof-like hydrolase [Desulforamulus ruminis DSM 2154]